ncbi:hypothetical protein [Mycolicibacterium rhodesiae]|nr:hypothetical protein [Mycolicibacterium rhodesiae]MCV7348268.1 hypothetical protein [Mycolicibacterium rhodesiae]
MRTVRQLQAREAALVAELAEVRAVLAARTGEVAPEDKPAKRTRRKAVQ